MVFENNDTHGNDTYHDEPKFQSHEYFKVMSKLHQGIGKSYYMERDPSGKRIEGRGGVADIEIMRTLKDFCLENNCMEWWDIGKHLWGTWSVTELIKLMKLMIKRKGIHFNHCVTYCKEIIEALTNSYIKNEDDILLK